jgi:DNA-binding transcriptional LysR family regulator
MAANKIVPDAPTPTLPARKSIPPFEALRAFDAVARLGGVRRAAQGLRRNHAVVSRHLRTIEEWTGTTLIERTPTGAVLTEDGERYHQKIAAAIDMISNATIDLMKRGVENCIDIWSMPGFAYQWLMGHLEEFEKANPGISLAIRPTRNLPDFDHHEADVSIRFTPVYGEPVRLSQSCKCIEIARLPIIAVASPAYLASAPSAETPRDFLNHQLIHEKNFSSWSGWLEAHGLRDEIDLSGLRLFHGHLTLDAARRGRGIALTNYYVAAHDLASGSLVEIGRKSDENVPTALGSYMFVARSDRWDVGAIRRFREWLIDTVAADQPPPSCAA